MSTGFKIGQTDVTLYFLCFNTTTGARDTAGVAYNAAGLTLSYTREREAEVTAVTAGSPAPASLVADNSVHADWGFRHVGAGLHRVDYPDTMCATGVKYVIPDVYGITDRHFRLVDVAELFGDDVRLSSLDEFIAWMNAGGFSRPDTTGDATLKNSSGADVTVPITTSATAQGIVGTG